MSPRQYQLDVHRIVEETLQRVKLSHLESTTRELVHAAVARALAPWQKQKQIADTIKEICEAYRLPWKMKHEPTWKARMRTAAADAIARLREGASASDMQAAGQNALVPLVREFEGIQARSKLVEDVWMELRGGTGAEWEDGKDAVRAALAKVPIEASQRELEWTRASALEAIRATMATRQDREMRAELLRSIEFRILFIGFPADLQKRASVELSAR